MPAPPLRRTAARGGWARAAAGWLLTCLLGATAALALAPPGPYPVGPVEVRARLTLQPGWTVIEVPPFGTLAARTHRSPLGLAVEIRAVDFNALQDEAGAGLLAPALQDQIQTAARTFILRVILVGSAGALAAAAAVAAVAAHGTGSRWPRAAVAAAPLAAALVLAGSLGSAWATYDPGSFREPEYSGALKSAPWMIGLADQALQGAGRLGQRLAAVAQGVDAMIQRLEAPEAFGAHPGELAVLVVSDIHNNPAAVDLVTAAARAFQVDLILDAGDLTDWGTVLESRLVEGVDNAGVPYLLVPGNHESPALIRQLSVGSGIQVLDEGLHRAAGLTIAAVPDPASARFLPTVAPQEELDAAGRRLLAAVEAAGARRVDVAVAHHPEVARPVTDRVPVVISGHTHDAWVRTTPAGVWLNPGTTGAAGIRGLESGSVPYTLMVLHLAREEDRWVPAAVDTIRASGFQTGFAVERVMLAPPAGAVDEAPGDPGDDAPGGREDTAGAAVEGTAGPP